MIDDLLKLADDIQEDYRYQGGKFYADQLRKIWREMTERVKNEDAKIVDGISTPRAIL